MTNLLPKVFLAITMFSSYGIGNAQDIENWTMSYGPNFRDINAVQILPDSRVISVGGNQFNDAISTISYSTDSGATWYIAMDFVNAWLQDLHFPNQNIGYTVGWSGNVWKSSDSGNSWDQISISGGAGSRHYNGCHFFDENTGVVVGGWPSNDAIRTILRTTDGGENWAVISDNLDHWLFDVHFNDLTTGYAVGNMGTVLKSIDAGLSWSTLDLPVSVASRQFNGVYFTDDMNGIIVGGWPSNDSIRTVIRTTDGGENWNIVMDSPGAMLQGVHFYDASNGYAVGDLGAVLVTEDGGVTWDEVELPDNNALGLKSVYFADAFFGICSGDDGKIYRYLDDSIDYASGSIQTPISLIDTNSAFIQGNVNDLGFPTLVEFEYGTNMEFGNTVDMTPNNTMGEGLVDVELLLTGLMPDVIYYGRMVLTNALGTSYSEIVSFYTGFYTIPNFNFEHWESFETDVLDEWFNEENTAPVSSYNGTLAARLQGGDDSAGAILLATPGENGLSGGIPFTERPDTLSFWVNHDIAEGDSAIVYLEMRGSGNAIAQNIFKYSGSTNGAFVNLKFPIEYFNEENPDTLTLGFASSNVFSDETNGDSFVELDDITFLDANSMLPNYDMESWSVSTRHKAVSWTSNDDAYNNGDPFIVERTDDAASGEWGLMLKNRVIDDYIDFARIKTGTDLWEWNPVFPVGYNHEFLYGYCQFFPEDNDTLFVYVSMFEDGEMIGGGQEYFTDTVSEYQLFSVPLNYWPGVADSALIEFSIYDASGSAGESYAIIDNLSFDVIIDPVLSIDEEDYTIPDALEVVAYPNPTKGDVTLQFSRSNNKLVEITVVDFNGKIISRENTVLTDKIHRLDLFGVSSGMYVILVRSGQHIYSLKIMVK